MRLIFLGCWLLLFCAMSSSDTGQSAVSLDSKSLVTGALVDEKTVAAVVHVDASGQVPGSVPTIKAGLEKSLDSLRRGVPTKVQIQSGVFRESAADVRFDEPTVRDTLFVIEAAPGAKVVWSGADMFPAAQWKDEGNGVWSHDWPHGFGNFAYPWSVPGVLGHRREMVWIDGQPLGPIVLETYDVSGLAQFGGTGVSWNYKAFLDPKKTLTPGSFGVAERAENGKRLYIRLAPGVPLPAQGIEVALRPALLNLAGKSRVVLRGLTFENVPTATATLVQESPVSFGASFSEKIVRAMC
jgi:hypothetical protein